MKYSASIRLPCCSRAFSTSTPRWPRTRALVGRRQRQDQPHEPHDERIGEENHIAHQRVAAPETPIPTERRRDDLPLPTDAPYRPKQRSAPAHMPPRIRDFFLPEIIRCPDSSSPITTSPSSQHEARRLALAAGFFARPARFLYSAGNSLRDHALNEHVPEVLVLGASNVGKSTLLNALVGRADAAHVSARPGRTTLMNAFGVGPPAKLAKGMVRPGEKMPAHSLVVVDTPGYGFKSQASWGDAVVGYMQARKMLRGAVVLMSSEKKVSEQDRWVLRALGESGTRTVVVLTKADKVGVGWREACREMAGKVREELRGVERLYGGMGRGWREGRGWDPCVYVTAAGLEKVPKLGNGGGVGGVRAAILEMAGFEVGGEGEGEGEVKMGDEAAAYTGEVVSFDDIKWKQ